MRRRKKAGFRWSEAGFSPVVERAMLSALRRRPQTASQHTRTDPTGAAEAGRWSAFRGGIVRSPIPAGQDAPVRQPVSSSESLNTESIPARARPARRARLSILIEYVESVEGEQPGLMPRPRKLGRSPGRNAWTPRSGAWKAGQVGFDAGKGEIRPPSIPILNWV